MEYAAHLQLLCGQMLRNLGPCVYRPQVLEELFQLSVRATPADRGMYPGLLAGLAPSSKQAKWPALRTDVFLFPYCHPESARSCLAGSRNRPCLTGRPCPTRSGRNCSASSAEGQAWSLSPAHGPSLKASSLLEIINCERQPLSHPEQCTLNI